MFNKLLKNKGYYTLVLIMLLVLAGCSSEEVNVEVVPNTSSEGVEEPDDSSGDDNQNDEIVDTSAAVEFAAQLGVGWNLGNSFDVESRDKTFWGNPLPTKEMIDLVADTGFKTLRVPVTWGYHQEDQAPFTIEQDYLQRVQDVVDYGLANDMFVIINVHHDDDWVQLVSEESAYVKERLTSLWQQVATHFQEYDEKLIFDILNEPRLKGTSIEWTGGDATSRSILNEYHKAGLDAIRMSGGNNESRFLMVSTYAASTLDGPMNDLVIPNNDPNVIISLHTYFPWAFAGDENGPDIWGSTQEKQQLDAEMNRIYQKWVVQEQRPVILGEWGTRNKDNLSERVEYATYYAEAALERGFVPVVWDDGGNFMLQDRDTQTWEFPEIIDAIIAAENNR
jgi:endoglucanase